MVIVQCRRGMDMSKLRRESDFDRYLIDSQAVISKRTLARAAAAYAGTRLAAGQHTCARYREKSQKPHQQKPESGSSVQQSRQQRL